jgi:hypothetical protein
MPTQNQRSSPLCTFRRPIKYLYWGLACVPFAIKYSLDFYFYGTVNPILPGFLDRFEFLFITCIYACAIALPLDYFSHSFEIYEDKIVHQYNFLVYKYQNILLRANYMGYYLVIRVITILI